MGPCAKRRVVCILVDSAGAVISYGENLCAAPKKKCPRIEGEGYTKCKTICRQPVHAEQAAARLIKGRGKELTSYLFGHDHYCDSCKGILEAVGVVNFRIGKPE